VLSGLQCGTTYYFRAVATTAQGSTQGGDQSFKTSACPAPMSPLFHGVVVEGTLAAGEPETRWRYFYFDLPEGWSSATVELFGLSQADGGGINGNANLYVRKGQLPTLNAFDCRSSQFSNTPESCDFVASPLPPAPAGRWYVGVNNDFAMENIPIAFSVRATWNPPTLAPIVLTGSASAVSRTGATLNAVINPRGSATVARFDYGPTPDYGNATPAADVGSGSADVPLARVIGGLVCATTYHFRAVATNADGTGEGEHGSFQTSDCPFAAPRLGNGIAETFTLPAGAPGTSWHHYLVELPEGVTSITAELSGLSDDADLYLRKDQPATSRIYDCRSFSGGTTDERCTRNGATTPPVSPGLWYVSVNNWTENVAVNYTLRVTWIVPVPASPPSVTTDAATGMSQTGATLNASVNPQGLETTVYFEYGPDQGYGDTTPPIDAGSGTAELLVDAAISGLACSQAYHFRAVVTNAIGTREGDDQVLQTSACDFEPPPLVNGETVSFTLPAGARHSAWHHFPVELPDGVSSVTAELFDLSDDADLYLRKGDPATIDSYDCASTSGGIAPDLCSRDGTTTPPASPGLWYVSVTNWAENVSLSYSLRVSWTISPPEEIFTDGFEDQ